MPLFIFKGVVKSQVDIKIQFVLFFATFFNAYNSFFNSLVFLIVLKKTVLDISECSKHKTKVQFLMYTFKKVLKIQNSRKIGKKISSAMRSRIFPIFLEFSFFNTFLKVCIKKNTNTCARMVCLNKLFRKYCYLILA